MHYFVWENVSCEICNKDYYAEEKAKKYKTPLTPSDFIKQVNKVYGINQLSSTIRWFHFIRTGDSMVLHPNQRKHLRLINKVAENTEFDFKEVCLKLDERAKKKRAKHKWTKKEETEVENYIMEKIETKDSS